MEIEASSSISQTEVVPSITSTTPPILKLRLQKKKSAKSVEWSNGTVDNENMNRKKSKCCCIYRKPLAFGESSSEEEEECEHCFGHPEKRKKIPKCPEPGHSGTLEPLDDGTDETRIPDQSDADQCTSGVCKLRKDVPNSKENEKNHAEN